MGLIQYHQITYQPVNQAICIFITVQIVFCNLVSIKCIIVLLLPTEANHCGYWPLLPTDANLYQY